MTQAATLAQLASSGALSADTSGNVGIGTTTPGYLLDVSKNQNAPTVARVQNTNTGVSAFSILQLQVGSTNYTNLQVSSSGNYFQIASSGVTTSYSDFDTQIWRNNAGTERMRIDTSGRLLIGGTSAIAPFAVFGPATNVAYGQIAAFSTVSSDINNAGISVTKYDNNTTTSQVFVRFLVNQAATVSGQINANGASSAAFGTYSDRRLKENITELPPQLDNIMALRPVEFDYIESEGGGHQIGFIAQEVKEVYPDLVGEREDGMFTLTDLNKNDARLIKAIQELKAELDVCKAEIAALKGV